MRSSNGVRAHWQIQQMLLEFPFVQKMMLEAAFVQKMLLEAGPPLGFAGFSNPRTTGGRAMKSEFRLAALAAVGLCGSTAVAQAGNIDIFTLTSCHISGGCGTATSFGTATLTQSGTSALFDVVLNSGNRFVETGSGGGQLFLFNDTISVSTITNALPLFATGLAGLVVLGRR
jgi:hypothetical protein